ncbi:hypothetical protein [Paenibacillus mucilaginosus]|uniref:Uncharacterized protein n=1 Tax=Paenibacillus mucilaginosus (strain KNP414) TaxID=1036673 RepID=F8FM42_PAEMK|nr:hypothetical protein [Paenibacillus mucilaginosus]AEI45668.1 hypothetical protein KNP414_07158 [Paenibacillus mucilaginosus KNP414]MCG7215138.1 hypothetical protein [Paenibacillus mucilaginosus]WDM27064.1 hypothetical protein KCX80_32470 [Paenibacillus mucilaginosus]
MTIRLWLYLTLAGAGAAAGSGVPAAAPAVEAVLAGRLPSAADSQALPLLAEGPGGLRLLAAEPSRSGMYRRLELHAGGISRTFEWSTADHPAFRPALYRGNYDGDALPEIAVELTQGYGSGVNVQELHVLNEEDWTEIPVEHPADAAASRVESEVTPRQDGTVHVSARTDGSLVQRTYSTGDAGSWLGEVHFGSIVEYRVDENRIAALLPGQVSPAEFALTAEAEYGRDLRVKRILLREDTTASN